MKINKKELLIISIIFIVFLSIFLTISVIVYNNNGELELDNNIMDYIYNIRGEKGEFWYYFFRIITEFGYIYAGVAIFIILVIYSKLDKGPIIFLVGVLFSTVLVSSIKLYFDRERPLELLQWSKENDTSFPSGHTTTATFIYSYLVYYLFKTNRKRSIKYTSLILSIVIIILVMISRLVLGMHHFTDVIAGVSLGIVACTVAIYIHIIFDYYGIMNKGIINFKRKNNEEDINN